MRIEEWRNKYGEKKNNRIIFNGKWEKNSYVAAAGEVVEKCVLNESHSRPGDTSSSRINAGKRKKIKNKKKIYEQISEICQNEVELV